MTAPVRTRPLLVTILVVLVVLGGIGWIVAGITSLQLIGVGVGLITAVGIVDILLGVAYLVVARGLLKGDPRARTVVLIVSVLQVLLWIIQLLLKLAKQMISVPAPTTGALVLSILIIIVLFLPKVQEFFGRQRA